MYLYEELLNEEYIKNIYNSIENNPRIPISHGIHHILNVLNYCKRLAVLFNLSEEERELLFAAAALHDVAQVFLQAHHAKNGSFMVKEMLENNETIDPDYIRSKVDIDRVCNIIKCHGGKNEEDYEDKLSCLLILADKLDITKDRIRKAYKKHDFLWFMEDVEKVNMELDDGCLNINILTNKEVTFEDLNAKNGIEKISNVLKMFSKKQGLKYKVIVKRG